MTKNSRPAEMQHLICDLDNTLYDWVAYFVPSFYAMVDEVIVITGWDRDKLLDGFRAVHQRHHNTEHPFALLEVDLVREHYANLNKAEVAKIFDSAFHAFNKTRKETLKSYPGVREALLDLKNMNVNLIAHTDSGFQAVVDRMKRLEFSEIFSTIYCRSRGDTEHPTGISLKEWAKDFPLDRVIELPKEQKKPNPTILKKICKKLRVDPSNVAYVGDSIARDIFMAKQANVTSIWAKYGTRHPTGMFEKLVRITHWTDEDVQMEKRLSEESKGVVPDYVLERSFDEVVGIFRR